MNFVKNQKAQVRIIEAILATILLMSCLTLIPAQPTVKNTPNLAAAGQNVLLSLDSNGRLASLVDSGNWAELQTCLESALPLTAWFNLTVFDANMNPINSYPISNAGAQSNKVVSVDYLCVSPSSHYNIYLLRLQLSEVGST